MRVPVRVALHSPMAPQLTLYPTYPHPHPHAVFLAPVLPTTALGILNVLVFAFARFAPNGVFNPAREAERKRHLRLKLHEMSKLSGSFVGGGATPRAAEAAAAKALLAAAAKGNGSHAFLPSPPRELKDMDQDQAQAQAQEGKDGLELLVVGPGAPGGSGRIVAADA